ncbi:MAG: hypothetical protein S4CHLAM37_08590 [Chlamydiia bacterium]|nr:hypothetical protein [Chlamydiia bacterium]
METQTLKEETKTSYFLAWVICICAGLFFAYELMQFHMLNAISPMLMKDLKITATNLGVLGSTYLLADVIFLLPAGIILDYFSTRKVILAALVVCILGTVGFALATNFAFACFAHFLSGIGNAFCFLSCMMFISRWFPPKKQAFVVGIVITLGMFGGVLAQAPFTILAESVTWRNAVLIDALIGVVIFFLIFFVVRDAPSTTFIKEIKKERNSHFFKDLFSCLLNKQNIFCGIYTSFTNLPLMVIGAAYGSLYLSQIHKIPFSEASFVTSMICMGTILGSTLFGYVSDKTGARKKYMMMGALASLACMLVILSMQHASFSVMLILFFLLGLLSSSQVLGYPLITEHSPKHLTGTSMAVAALIIMGFPGLVQFICGKLIDSNWSGKIVDGTPIYAYTDFLRGFMVFPVTFLFAFIAALFIKESKAKTQEA